MFTPSKPAPGYVSPTEQAEKVLARAAAGERISKQAISSARRIVALPSWAADLLAKHGAPYRVACWVAWGGSRYLKQRADLALVLRRARPSKGWPDARHLEVAFDVYLEACAHGLGGLETLVSDVPVERYFAVIDALPKRSRGVRRRASTNAESAPAIETESDVLHALVSTKRPRPARAPVIRLRVKPLEIRGGTRGTPTASSSEELDRAQAENALLRSRRDDDALEAQRDKDSLLREIERLTAKVERLERESKARSGGAPNWLVGLGGLAVGAVASEIVRGGVDQLQAQEARAHRVGRRRAAEQLCEVLPGYTANGGRLLRAASVVVSKGRTR